MNKFRFLAVFAVVFVFAVTFLAMRYSSTDARFHNENEAVKAEEVNISVKEPVVERSIRLCGTDDSPERIAKAEKDFALRHGQLQKAGGTTANVTGGTINVYYHVINRGSGIANGDVPLSQIQAQIQVLNSAFGGSFGWGYTLAGVTRTTNSRWYSL